MKELRNLEATLTKKIILTPEELEDIFVTALEGAINYWASIDTEGAIWLDAEEECNDIKDYSLYTSMIAKYIVCDIRKTVFIEDLEEGGELLELTYDKFVKGVELYCQDRGNIKTILENGDFDAEEADVLFQYALFGDIIYG